MPNWKKLVVSGSDASLNNLIVNNAVTASYFKGDGSALTNVQTQVTEVTTIVDSFTSQTSVVTTHNFGTKNILVSVYDDNDQVIIPASITTTTDNIVTTTFDIATTGRVVVAKGGHLVSGVGTASNSNTLNGQSGSYYLDYNNFTNVPTNLAITGSNSFVGTQIFTGSLIPGANELYDLGSATARWRDLYLSGSTIFLGDTKITTDVSGNVEFRDRTTNTRKVLKVDEIELGSGASARRIKVDEGNIAFTTTGDTSITATTDAELNASSSALIAGYTAADTALSSSLAADIATNSSDLSTHIGDTSNPHSVTAAQVGLGNVTNESKATMFNSPAFTGNPTAPTQAGTDDSTKLATTAFVQGRIDAIIGTAGATLDTLGELSASLANDQDALTALTTTVGTKLVKSANLSDLTDAAAARTNLGVDPAGTDNSTDVTLVTTSHDYLSITGQAITLGTIQNNDLANSSITVNGTATSLGGSVTLDADDIDDTSTTHKFATAAQLAQIATNANAISNLNNTYTTDAELNASSSALISGFTGADTALSSSLAADIAINTAKIGVTTETVRTAGALMDDEVDADIKTLSLPASTTISAFGKTLVDDADAATARTTLGVDAAGTDNSTDVTLAGAYDYITISGQTITRNQITNDDLEGSIANAKLANSSITINGSAVSLGGTRTLVTDDIAEDGSPVNLWYTDARVKTKLDSDSVVSGSATQVRTFLNVENGADVTDTANVTAAGALMDLEVTSLSGIKTLTVPDNTTISSFGASLVDDADASAARTTLGVDAAGTDNSTDVTLVTTSHDYLSLSGQAITLGTIDISDDTNFAVSDTTGQTGINLTLTGDTLSGVVSGLGTTANVTFATASISQNLTVGGNLTVLGSRTELQVTNLNVEDKNILIASGAADSAAADGAGITIGGANESITWNHASSRFDISDDVNVTGNITLSGTVDGVDIAALNTTVGNINTQVPAIYDNAGTPALNTGITEAEIKTLLNLEIGTDVQAYDADLTTLGGLAKTDGNFIVGNGSTWVVESGATARTSLGLGTAATAASTDFMAVTGDTATGTIYLSSAYNRVMTGNTNNTSTADTSAGLILHQSSYSDGRYSHRFRKYDHGGGVPLYIDGSGATANIFTPLARFGTYTGNGYEFEVFGDINATGTIYDSGNRVLTTADEGTGNGLDADTLDGQHASAFLTAESDTLATVTGRGASTTTGIQLNSGATLDFNKTNATSGGDTNFITIGYNGSWSSNANGMAAIEVNDGSGTVGKFGISYNATDEGYFAVKNLYNGGSYGASGIVFKVDSDGDGTFSGGLSVSGTSTLGALNVGGAAFFNGSIGNSPAATPGVHVGISAGNDGQIQINGTSAHIDFANAGSEDFDMRIILQGNDELGISGGNLDLNANHIVGVGDLYVADQIIHDGDTDTYTQFHAADQWRVVTGGTERFEVNNTITTVQGDFQVLGDLKLNGTDSFIWTPNTSTGYTGFWDQYNARVAAKWQNNLGWGFLGDPESGFAVKVTGNTKVTGNLEVDGYIQADLNTASSRDKIRLWTDSSYTIGMQSGVTFGGLNDWAMTFQFNSENDRGFWWGDTAHSTAQGAMALTTNGDLTVASKVKIGYGESDTATPTIPLDVYGSGSTVFQVEGSLGQLFSVDDDLTGEIFAVSDISGIPIMSIDSGGVVTIDDTLYVTGDITAYYSSDERLKKNIKPIEKPLEKLKQISGNTFEWDEENPVHRNTGKDVGVIAQEIEKVLPELVTERKGGYKAVQYEKIVALLIESNKALLERVEELEKKLK